MRVGAERSESPEVAGGPAWRRWGPGYGTVAVSTVALVLTAPGQTLLVSLLNLPLREAFGMEAFTLSSAYTVATVTASLPLVWVGRLTDRYGPRRMMVAVALAFGAACVFMASVAHVAMVFAGFFLLRFLGQGSLSLVSGHVMAMWFHRRLGRLDGLRAVVLFAAWAPLPAFALWLIGTIGWRATWASFGVFIAVTVPVLVLRFLHDRPEDVGLTLDGGGSEEVAPPESEPGLSLRDALRTRAYWLLVFSGAIPPMVGTAILFDVQPLLGGRGLSPEAAARAVSAWSAAMALLAIPTGYLIDRLRPGPLLAAGTLAIGGSCVALLGVRSEATAIGAIALNALGQSLVVPACAATVLPGAARAWEGRGRGRWARGAPGVGRWDPSGLLPPNQDNVHLRAVYADPGSTEVCLQYGLGRGPAHHRAARASRGDVAPRDPYRRSRPQPHGTSTQSNHPSPPAPARATAITAHPHVLRSGHGSRRTGRIPGPPPQRRGGAADPARERALGRLRGAPGRRRQPGRSHDLPGGFARDHEPVAHA